MAASPTTASAIPVNYRRKKERPELKLKRSARQHAWPNVHQSSHPAR